MPAFTYSPDLEKAQLAEEELLRRQLQRETEIRDFHEDE